MPIRERMSVLLDAKGNDQKTEVGAQVNALIPQVEKIITAAGHKPIGSDYGSSVWAPYKPLQEAAKAFLDTLKQYKKAIDAG